MRFAQFVGGSAEAVWNAAAPSIAPGASLERLLSAAVDGGYGIGSGPITGQGLWLVAQCLPVLSKIRNEGWQ